MKGSRLPWLKRDTGPARVVAGQAEVVARASTGQVSTSAKSWEAVNSIG